MPRSHSLDLSDPASYGPPAREETRGRPLDGDEYADGTIEMYERRAGRPSGQTFRPEPDRSLKPWEPTRLGPKHRQVLALSAAGCTNKEIAEITDYSESWISVILNHPDAQILRDRFTSGFVGAITDSVREHIEAHTAEALHTVVDLMRNASSETVRQRSAFDILDRGGFKPKDVNVNHNINMRPEDAKMIADALHESEEPIEDLPPVSDSHEVLRERGKLGAGKPPEGA